MKKSFMTRVLATGLSLAMAFSLSTATSLVSAGAASKPVLVDYATGGSGKAVTVNVGEVAKLKMDPTNKTYVVASVKKSSQKIKASVSKNGKVVYVRGVAATGEKDSAIRASFKVKKTGKISKFTFAAKVKVVEKEAPKPTCVKLTGAAQKEATKIAVTFDNAAVTPGAVSAFKVVRNEGNVVIPVKAVSYDADKKGATIELYNGVTDAKEYTVTFTDADEAKTESTATFTATDNKIADIQLNKTTIVAKTADEVKVKTFDAQGVLLKEYKLTEAEANKMTIEVKSANNTGYRAGDNVYVAAVGDVLTVKVTLHTYKYENGTEVGTIERTFELTGATEDYAAISYGYTIAKDQPNFNAASYKQSTTVAKSQSDAQVWFNFKNGSVNKNDLFSVESSDNSIAIIAKTDLKNAVNYGVAIKPVKEGSAYIVVKDASGNLVTTLPFSVGAASKASSITLSATSITTSDVAGLDKPTSTVTVKDQYNNPLNIKNLKVEATDRTTATSAEAITTKKADNKTIEVDGVQAPAGKTISYAYKVTAETNEGNMTAYLNVTILHGSSSEKVNSYDLLLSTTSVDLAITDKDKNYTTGTNTFSAVTFRIGKYNTAGACIGYLDIPASKAAISVVSTDNSKTLAVVSGADLNCDDKQAGVLVSVTSQGAASIASAVNKLATAGKTYTVKAEFVADGKTTTLIKTFDVKDTQGTFTFKVKDTSKAANDKTNLQLFKGGDEVKAADFEIEEIKSVKSGKVETITSIVFVYKIGTNAHVYVTATPDGTSSVTITLP